jgi:hypothetical protein
MELKGSDIKLFKYDNIFVLGDINGLGYVIFGSDRYLGKVFTFNCSEYNLTTDRLSIVLNDKISLDEDNLLSFNVDNNRIFIDLIEKRIYQYSPGDVHAYNSTKQIENKRERIYLKNE